MDQQISGILEGARWCAVEISRKFGFVLPKTHRIEGRFASLLWGKPQVIQ
jgi:hypothetical protein